MFNAGRGLLDSIPLVALWQSLSLLWSPGVRDALLGFAVRAASGCLFILTFGLVGLVACSQAETTLTVTATNTAMPADTPMYVPGASTRLETVRW